MDALRAEVARLSRLADPRLYEEHKAAVTSAAAARNEAATATHLANLAQATLTKSEQQVALLTDEVAYVRFCLGRSESSAKVARRLANAEHALEVAEAAAAVAIAAETSRTTSVRDSSNAATIMLGDAVRLVLEARLQESAAFRAADNQAAAAAALRATSDATAAAAVSLEAVAAAREQERAAGVAAVQTAVAIAEAASATARSALIAEHEKAIAAARADAAAAKAAATAAAEAAANELHAAQMALARALADADATRKAAAAAALRAVANRLQVPAPSAPAKSGGNRRRAAPKHGVVSAPVSSPGDVLTAVEPSEATLPSADGDGALDITRTIDEANPEPAAALAASPAPQTTEADTSAIADERPKQRSRLKKQSAAATAAVRPRKHADGLAAGKDSTAIASPAVRDNALQPKKARSKNTVTAETDGTRTSRKAEGGKRTKKRRHAPEPAVAVDTDDEPVAAAPLAVDDSGDLQQPLRQRKRNKKGRTAAAMDESFAAEATINGSEGLGAAPSAQVKPSSPTEAVPRLPASRVLTMPASAAPTMGGDVTDGPGLQSVEPTALPVPARTQFAAAVAGGGGASLASRLGFRPQLKMKTN